MPNNIVTVQGRHGIRLPGHLRFGSLMDTLLSGNVDEATCCCSPENARPFAG